MYENQTYEAIMARLLANVPDTLDKREGSFIWDALSPAALELAQAYIMLDLVLKYGFAQTTYGQYLDYRAAEHGLTRKEATKATGQVVITGASGTTVPAGSLFATAAGVQFVTTADVIIGDTGTVTADIEAVEAGANGNVPSGAITQIPVSIAGVTAVTNLIATSGGTDMESDTDLLARYLERVRNPATSGNAAHYKQWALEVDGVGGAKVLPLWNDPGTVKVVIIDSNKQPASADIVNAVAEYIESVRPIGASVTVESAVGAAIDIAATVTLSEDATLAEVQAAFEVAVTSYLQEIAFAQDYVSYAKIGSILLGIDGVLDYTGLTLNGGTGNVSVGDTEVGILGTVTLSE